MESKPPELASTMEEHEAAALYHDEKERVIRSAGWEVMAGAHRNAALLHRQALRLGPDTVWLSQGELIDPAGLVDPADDSPQQCTELWRLSSRVVEKGQGI